jgi:hypothetical protein
MRRHVETLFVTAPVWFGVALIVGGPLRRFATGSHQSGARVIT